MRYRVEITEPAQQNIQEAYDWLAAESSWAAVAWIDGLLETIDAWILFRCAARWHRKARTIRRKSVRYSTPPTGFCFLSESQRYLCSTSGIARGIALGPKIFFDELSRVNGLKGGRPRQKEVTAMGD